MPDAPDLKLRYWDSDAFIAWLLPELPRVPECRAVIRSAERGESKIITSALTLVEVLHLKGKPKLNRDHHDKIKKFFARPFITVVNVDRYISETSRELVWKNNLTPKDAVHLASAMWVQRRVKLWLLETYDGDLLALSGKYGKPPITIQNPHEVEQQDLFNKPPDQPKATEEHHEDKK